jgi:hypothetical protein
MPLKIFRLLFTRDGGMKTFECANVELDVRAPISVAWGLIADIPRWPEWRPTVLSISQILPGPLRVGTSYRVQQPGLPERDWTVTFFDDQRELTWETQAMGLRMVASHIVRRARSTSQIQLRFSLSGTLAPIILPFVRPKISRAIQLEIRSVKLAAEGLSISSGCFDVQANLERLLRCCEN